MNNKNEVFWIDELELNYHEFKKVRNEKYKELREDMRECLHAWEMYDLNNSPMDDNKRSYIRLGFFEGWFYKS